MNESKLERYETLFNNHIERCKICRAAMPLLITKEDGESYLCSDGLKLYVQLAEECVRVYGI